MKYQTSSELRNNFLSFWESKGSRRYPSFSLVPDDPTLLFTVAGMVPFKPFFLGIKTPEVLRAVTAQKCIRTNDIENVGRTARHHTFFEMLGNFSFGDYFKAEAIRWAWEFLTEKVGLQPDKLYATVYLNDDEAAGLWQSEIGLSQDRIFRLGAEDNFWAAGPVGPCGPCSEIIYDQGERFSCGKPTCNVGCDCDRYLEIWNLVFMQFNRDEEEILSPLPKKNIDTGMGLERLASIVQNADTDFETDLFSPIIDATCRMAGMKYGSSDILNLASRVISDHVRASAFMIADGILPANDGTGYVLRRLLRRAMRYGHLIGIKEAFLGSLLPVVEQQMQDPYAELITNRATIAQVVELEEKRFARTLEMGTALLEQEIKSVADKKNKKDKSKVLGGEVAFLLHDTYGFPLELTEEMCAEHGIAVDKEKFTHCMNEQKERARAASKHSSAVISKNIYTEIADKHGATEFLGYKTLEATAEVIAIVCDDESTQSIEAPFEGEIFLSATPFYAQRGGQVGDTGNITAGHFGALVTDTSYPYGEIVSHKIKCTHGKISVGDTVVAAVDARRRGEIAKHHTATHLLHQALILTMGEHVRQGGSHVSDLGLRFDYNHISPLSIDSITTIEDIVNGIIMDNKPVTATEMRLDEAKALGAKALFEEKYGDTVRVIKTQGFSSELCGGTHVDATGKIGLFKILKDDGIGAGTRRIEAIVGFTALKAAQEAFYYATQASTLLAVKPQQITEKIHHLLEEKNKTEKSLAEATVQAKLASLDTVVFGRKRIKDDVEVQMAFFEGMDADTLRQIGDGIKGRFPRSVSLIVTINEERFQIIIMATDSCVKMGVHAGNLAKEISAHIGASGGGRPNTAQIGGKVDLENKDFRQTLKKGLENFPDIVEKQIK